MKAAKILLAGPLGIAIVASAAFAQEGVKGTLTKIDRLSGTIAVKQTPTGTVGASASASEEFKVSDRAQLDNFHAGDRVTFSVTEAGGVKTITKLQKQ